MAMTVVLLSVNGVDMLANIGISVHMWEQQSILLIDKHGGIT